MTEQTNPAAHWSFWLIGGLTLAYNLAGCLNFVMQLNPEAVSAMPDAIRILVETRPAWATAAFAVAVFGGALGCALLIMKNERAYPVLIASFAGALITLADTFIRSGPMEAVFGNLFQLAITAFLIGYARWLIRTVFQT